jgi:hypothetical protein
MEVDRLRERLARELELMDQRRQLATGSLFCADDPHTTDNPSAFDDLDEPEEQSRDQNLVTPDSAAHEVLAEIVPVEMRLLALPSSCSSCPSRDREAELSLRIGQAERTIHALRDTIADKSFQYSHVIRVAPRKHVHTRARATITKLNNIIAYHCRVYSHCRAAMVRLGASDFVLGKYQILLKEDVKSSSALLNPNEPGSSRVRLSWIWESNISGSSSSSSSVRECESCWSRCCSVHLQCQLIGCTGFGPVHREIGGEKNTDLSGMRCNGQSAITSIVPKCGKIGLLTLETSGMRGQQHMPVEK